MSLPNSTQRQEMMKLSLKQLKKQCKTLRISATVNNSHTYGTPPPYTEHDIESDNTSHQLLLLSGYELINETDSDRYSITYVGNTNKKSDKLAFGKKITIKKLKGIFNTQSHTKHILKELRILHSLNHNNIIKLYDIISPKTPNNFIDLTLILEFVPSNLATIFTTNQFFTPLHIQYMLYQILLGVKYLHSVHLAHLNLTSSAILINENCRIIISDFMNAYNFQTDNQEIKSVTEIYNSNITLYTDPQIILLQLSDVDNVIITALDVWSIGCIFGEFLQMLKENVADVRDRKPIFYGENGSDYVVRDKIKQIQIIFAVIGTVKNEKIEKYLDDLFVNEQKENGLIELFPGCDEDTLDLISNLLIFDVDKRFDINQALQHKYFNCVRDKKLEYMENKKINNLLLKFEKKDMRILILDEIKKYNIKIDNNNCNDEKYKLDIVLDGYIRIYIVPLIDKEINKIPKSVTEILYMYIAL